MERFMMLARAYKEYLDKERPDCKGLLKHTLAQWALESGWGDSKLATHYNNFGGMKYRRELADEFPTHAPYTDWSGEEVPYFLLDTLEEWPSLYFAFIGRSVYDGWEAHKDCGHCFMRHLAKSGYCGSMKGVKTEDVPSAYAARIENIIESVKFQEVLAYAHK